MAMNRLEREQRIMARREFSKAIRRGLIKRASACERCGVVTCSLDGHHCDYAKPLEVKWLCQKCHYFEDSEVVTGLATLRYGFEACQRGLSVEQAVSEFKQHCSKSRHFGGFVFVESQP